MRRDYKFMYMWMLEMVAVGLELGEEGEVEEVEVEEMVLEQELFQLKMMQVWWFHG